MKKPDNSIALISQFNNETSLANAQLLADEGFRLAITGSVQETLANAVEEIGNGALGVLTAQKDIEGMVSTYKKVTCYFNGYIDFLIINTPHRNSNGVIDFTEAFFMVQYALPFLKPNATVLFNTVVLTKGNLERIRSRGATTENLVNILWLETQLRSGYPLSFN